MNISSAVSKSCGSRNKRSYNIVTFLQSGISYQIFSCTSYPSSGDSYPLTPPTPYLVFLVLYIIRSHFPFCKAQIFALAFLFPSPHPFRRGLYPGIDSRTFSPTYPSTHEFHIIRIRKHLYFLNLKLKFTAKTGSSDRDSDLYVGGA